MTYEQRLRIENNRQEALTRRRRTLELRQQQRTIIITEEQRARIEQNRLQALERKRQHIQKQLVASLTPKDSVPLLLQSSSTSQIAQNESINITTPPAKRQKTQLTYHNKTYNNCSSSLSDKCKYCKNEMYKHKAYFGNGLLMCKLSGYYRCGCGRTWIGGAYKVTHTSARSNKGDSSFPKYTFPDCRICKSNNRVKLVKHKLKIP